MDIHFKATEATRIVLNSNQINSRANPGQTIRVGVESPTISVKPKVVQNTAYKFAMQIISGNGNIVRLTYDEWLALTEIQSNMWYAVTTSADEVRYLYLGNTLIAKASDDGSTWGFAYSFPIVFGR